VLALLLSYAVRFDFFLSPEFTQHYLTQMTLALLAVVPLKVIIFAMFGLYRGMWRYTNLRDMREVAWAVLTASLVINSLIAYLYHFQGFSRSVYLLDFLLTFMFVGGIRVAVRLAYNYRHQNRWINPLRWGVSPAGPARSVRTLVIGAGTAGERLVRALDGQPDAHEKIVCFLDDDPSKTGRSIHRIRVFGGVERLPAAVEKYGAEQILIAITKIDGPRMRRIVESCEKAGLPFKILPDLQDVVSGNVSVKDLRDVDFSDLLGRPPVELDRTEISRQLSGETILVTGAGGSIGSELCRQIVRFKPKKMILLDACEENLFNIQMELTGPFEFKSVVPVLGKVQDEGLMRRVFDKYRPSTVFHAAAYKHVPMLELNPWQALKNNVIGSAIAMKTARDFSVERFVLVSTDKAVRPTNVMGASKRMAELIMQAFSQEKTGTRFMAVRFGNVVGSSGSVVPLFRKQIAAGGPVTVTHPDVTRYFMSIPEAAQLILQAGAIGMGGEVFILKMGEPVKIIDMARDLIRLSGKKEEDIEVKITGLRPGEKLYEELITEGEGVVETKHKKIMVLKNEFQSDASFSLEHMDEQLSNLWKLAEDYDPIAIRDQLQKLVPEYEKQDGSVVL
jgi:FlaA1/EpsC-like NDP-sugar epimerase